jgi:hypothetical protein
LSRRGGAWALADFDVDVAVLNGTVTAVAKALPIISGTEQDHIAARALLIDAAFDLSPDVVKLAVHDAVPDDRQGLMAETRSVLTDLTNTVVIDRPRFETLQNRFAARFFPELP